MEKRLLEDILASTAIFTGDEINAIRKFSVAASKFAAQKGVSVSSGWDLDEIAGSIGINTANYPKEGMVMVALWVIFFSLMRKYLPGSELKYQSLEEFLSSYDGYFDDHPPEEQAFLWEEANWMNEMFKILPAKKNKGVAIQVIPRVVEGWGAKYVTGSGQKKSTADRVHVFETEGDVQPCHRGGRISASKPKKKKRRARKRAAVPAQTQSQVHAETSAPVRILQKRKPISVPDVMSHPDKYARVTRSRTREPALVSPDTTATTATTSAQAYSFPDEHADYVDPDTDGDFSVEYETEDLPFTGHFNGGFEKFLDDLSDSCDQTDSSESTAGKLPALSVPPDHDHDHPPELLCDDAHNLAHPTFVDKSLVNNGFGGHFQPLFDFGYAPSPLTMTGKATLPPLKRFFSWDSQYDPDTAARDREQKDPNTNANTNAGAREHQEENEKERERVTEREPVKDFLFDDYLRGAETHCA